MDSSQLLTREQLAKTYQWSLYPEPIQERLYAHYVKFIHEGNQNFAESDSQSATSMLEKLVQGERIDGCLSDHLGYFGQASADDVADIIQQFLVLKQ
jgi:hypothetical protein